MKNCHKETRVIFGDLLWTNVVLRCEMHVRFILTLLSRRSKPFIFSPRNTCRPFCTELRWSQSLAGRCIKVMGGWSLPSGMRGPTAYGSCRAVSSRWESCSGLKQQLANIVASYC
ncbi:hypothetical protein XELAEV_18041543mg [Xenopus laevis]|uniref:Uncharacterized protein n=1 Tax=Xenopus laevis TaxID=8355 RepID=A0A974C2F1_XENLA|nr:hypothetical protein XELAEV_18041543mg [Xenopus laevis]